MLRYLTAGESHGKALIGILEGMPKGVPVVEMDFVPLMAWRQAGYGRGLRCKIESDSVEILSGIRFGKTLGSPISLMIENRDYANWSELMDHHPGKISTNRKVAAPRPGHADLAGAMKYGCDDIRDILERASARETAMRVALSVPARKMLAALNIESVAFVAALGGIAAKVTGDEPILMIKKKLTKSGAEFLSPDPSVKKAWKKVIDEARLQGDTLGGVVEIRFGGLPPGLGSHVAFDRRLDGLLGQALLSLPAVKAVEIGQGFSMAGRLGSEVRDQICFSTAQGYSRSANFGGGLEGGMTNGETLVVRCSMKPIPTVRGGSSIELKTHRRVEAVYERSDTAAVQALALVAESVVALGLAGAILEKFGGDTLADMLLAEKAYRRRLKAL